MEQRYQCAIDQAADSKSAALAELQVQKNRLLPHTGSERPCCVHEDTHTVWECQR